MERWEVEEMAFSAGTNLHVYIGATELPRFSSVNLV